jgi:hypothetical protein
MAVKRRKFCFFFGETFIDNFEGKRKSVATRRGAKLRNPPHDQGKDQVMHPSKCSNTSIFYLEDAEKYPEEVSPSPVK